MDVDAAEYGADHGALRASISELEHRLGALIVQVGAGLVWLGLVGWLVRREKKRRPPMLMRHSNSIYGQTPQAFDDCTTLTSTFKLLDSCEGLLEREAIAAELAKKQVGGDPQARGPASQCTLHNACCRPSPAAAQLF
jgi:hypothetical protein